MRERLLTAGLLLLVLAAGCTDPADQRIEVQVQPADASTIVERTTEPINHTSLVARAAIRNGTTGPTLTRIDTLGPPAVRANGSYYNITPVVQNQINVTYVHYSVTTVSDGDAEYNVSELPTEDQTVIAVARYLADSEDGTGESGIYPNETSLQRSILASETPVTVALNGTQYRVEELEREAGTETRYVYEATLIATNTTAYTAYVTETYAVSIEEFSPEAMDFFRNISRGDGFFSGEGGEGYVALRNDLPPKDQGYENEWLVRANGTAYWLDIYVDDGDVLS